MLYPRNRQEKIRGTVESDATEKKKENVGFGISKKIMCFTLSIIAVYGGSNDRIC